MRPVETDILENPLRVRSDFDRGNNGSSGPQSRSVRKNRIQSATIISMSNPTG